MKSLQEFSYSDYQAPTDAFYFKTKHAQEESRMSKEVICFQNVSALTRVLE